MNRRSSNWDLSRFVKTLSYFGAVPILSQVDWFQQWLGSRPNPTVDSRSLRLTPTSVNVPETSAMPQTLLILGTGDLLTATLDRLNTDRLNTDRLKLQGNPPIRAVRLDAPLDGASLPIREGVEWMTIDLQQPPSPELMAEVRAIICAIASDQPASLVESTVRFLLEAIQRSEVQLPIFDFGDQSTNLSEIWGALDDVVMGGVSQSGIRLNGNLAAFSGQVSTANSGGFASVRTRNLEPPIDLSKYDGIELRLQGDGNRYKFMLRGETQWDGVAHCASFDTIAQTWITVRIPFSTLIPVFRARTLQDAPLRVDRIRAFQLMLSKFEYDGALNPHFQPGFFQLQVQSIAAYQQQNRSPFVLASAPNSEAELLLRQSGIPHRIFHLTEANNSKANDLAKIAEDCVKAIEF